MVMAIDYPPAEFGCFECRVFLCPLYYVDESERRRGLTGGGLSGLKELAEAARPYTLKEETK